MEEEGKTNTGGEGESRPIGLRTFSSDVAEAVKREQGSIIKVAVNEYERRQHEQENVSPTSKKNILFLTVGIIFLAGAAGLLFYTLLSRPKDNLPAPAPAKSSIIYADFHTGLVIDRLTGSRLAERLRNQIALSGKSGTIEDIYLTENGGLVETERFLALLGAHTQPNLTRSLTNEFMVGSYKTTDSGHAFIVLQTRDFANTFAGMLDWEGRLWEDFYKIFGTETPGQVTDLARSDFEDLLIKNKNARALKRADKTIAILYIFLDEKNLLIADNVETVTEVLARGMLR